MVEQQKPLVVITGVSGYLGSQVLNEFLQGEGKNKYRIRATVRDKNNQAKLKPLQDFFGEALFTKIEFVSAELTNQAQIEAAIQGADFVVHTASPVGTNPRNHDDMIRPAVNGVTFVLEAAAKNKVKRVVITSSVAAVGHPAPENDDYEYDENSWTDVASNDYSAYIKSKTIAERAAWDFQKKMQANGQFCSEIATINPSWILGETIGCGDQTSVTIVRRMIMNEMRTGYPSLRMNCVDVKDCAKAHIRALERPEAANKRFILSLKDDQTMFQLANQLYDALVANGYNYRMERAEIGYCTLKFASYFSSEVAFILPLCNKPSKVFKNDRSREILGIEYKRSEKELLLETCESMMKMGIIPTRRA